MNSKIWWKSKTVWLNLIGVAALLIQNYNGFIIDPELQAAALGAINLVLRLITRQSLDWSKPGDDDRPHLMPPTSPSGSAGYVRRNLIIGMCGLIVIITCFIMLSGCATTSPATPKTNDSPQVLAGKSLLAVKGTITTAATTTDALCKAGTLKPDICSQARDAYLQARPAYDAAVDAYLLLSTQGGDPAAFGAALIRVQSIASNLLLISGGADPLPIPLPKGEGTQFAPQGGKDHKI